MRRELRLRRAAACLLLWLAAAAPAAAIDVLVRSPRPGQPVFGEVEVEVDVLAAAPVAAVIIAVDGRVAATLTEPPFRTTVDVGSDNREHTFEITARDAAGAAVTVTRVTPKVQVDERLDLELQQLYVTVLRRSPDSAPVPRSEFAVFDAGDRQEIVTFEGGDAPLTAVLLVDTSTSMRGGRLETAVEGAESFLWGMRQLDEAMVTLVSDRRIRATPFADDPDAIAAGLRGVTADGGTALNDYLYYAIKLLEGRQGRRVVVVLSDGIDTDSVLGADDVRWALKRSQALVYWIRLRDSRDPGTYSSSWRDRHEHAHELEGLEKAVAETGGRVFEIEGVEQASSAFRSILSELRSQYVLGYYPSRNQGDGAWHPVQVEVRGRRGTVRTREGYIDY